MSSPASRVSRASRVNADDAGSAAQSSRWPSRWAAIWPWGRSDARMVCQVAVNRAAGQAPAAVDEVGRGEHQVGVVGHQRLQLRPVGLGDVALDQGDRGWLAVHRKDCPAPGQQLEGVGAVAAS
jgi:hypothetical protein